MTSKVEEVAWAICQAEDAWIQQAGDALDGMQEEPKYSLPETLSRAAIEAMKIPTEKMIEASSRADGLGAAGYYRAMMDAALDEYLEEYEDGR